jgi:hypothetical protein
MILSKFPFPLSVHNANAGPQDLSRIRRDESLSAEPANGFADQESRIAGFKCRRWPTLDEKRFELPTLFQGIAVSQSKTASVFKQLPRYRLERNFGKRSAPLREADGDPLLEAPKEWIGV